MKLFMCNSIYFKGIIPVLCVTCLHGMYAYVTVSQKNIKIMSKYIDKYNNNIVIDINNNLYKVNNSFWHQKWNSSKDWNEIQIGTHLSAKMYGINVPYLGVIPNIILLNNDNYSKNSNPVDNFHLEYIKYIAFG